jgi:hypothetical protein
MNRYTRQDLNIVSDAVSMIQRHPSMYLRGRERATGKDLASHMMFNLIWLGALPATVTRFPPWWVVSSEKIGWPQQVERTWTLPFRGYFPFRRQGLTHFVLRFSFRRSQMPWSHWAQTKLDG